MSYDIMFDITFSGRRARYLDISDAIAAALRDGTLRDGDRLPTHREVADRTGVSLATVTKGYAEAQRLGLLQAVPGRGTFVTALGTSAVQKRRKPGTVRDLSSHLIPIAPDDAGLAEAMRRAVSRLGGFGAFSAVPALGTDEDRAAGAAWLRRVGEVAEAAEVAVCGGSQHALLVVIASLTRPGEAIGTEALTDPSFRMVAALSDRRLLPLPATGWQLDTDRLEDFVRGQDLRMLVVTPNLANPTNATMDLAGRQALVRAARACDAVIVESDLYGPLLEDRLPSIRSLAPERTLFVSSLSKVVGPGAKVAYVAGPKELLERLAAGIRMSVGMTTPLIPAVATELISSGSIDRIVGLQREECARRAAMADRHFGRFGAALHPRSWHAWVPLPDAWTPDTFVAASSVIGIRLAESGAFNVGRGGQPGAVRVCLGGDFGLSELEEACRRLADLAGGRPPPVALRA
ncbi:aminotransferase-like domain-containing protein [Roseococcus pinisoli]|uniref:PLP-dependent aminotransferase family protein n=1 Tax=Roseococcus pinisoli TaxID=2835040 RepID=A0ABS5QEG5_9PROT|nr:PLP-dependent aminotransferase family protein [Roseococcus pinisoli]MBS7811873.1 PLP-dependent aminotransferase family protein [Roseococcus pinisoli]